MKIPKEFWSIEAIPPEEHIKEENLTLLDEIRIAEDAKCIRYMDDQGRGWYKSMRLVMGHWVDLEVAVFGHHIKRRKKQQPA